MLCFMGKCVMDMLCFMSERVCGVCCVNYDFKIFSLLVCYTTLVMSSDS
jgi:hypothetical protein